MSAGLHVSRRSLLRRVLQAFAMVPLGAMVRAAEMVGDGRPAGRTFPGGAVSFERYRVEAVIMLLGVPVIRKDGVGAAGLMVEEAVAESQKATAIQFVAGSWPDRLKGFNRFGMTREIVREDRNAICESRYLSFMTSSPEKNSDQAWHAFTERSQNLTLAVACGVANSSGYDWALEHQTIPARATWMDCPSLMESLRIRGVGRRSSRMATREGRTDSTFLNCVRKAMQRHADGSDTFIHNAKLYDLHFRFAKAEGASLLIGRTLERETTSESEFRVWFDSDDPGCLPSKIEFRPRSFLRLIFHRDPDAGGPLLQPLVVQQV